MKKKKDFTQLSASDLANFLNCHHLTELDKKVIRGELEKPTWNNPHVQVLRDLGDEHEVNYLEYLTKKKKLKVKEIPEDIGSSEAFELTKMAMAAGADVIAQGVLKLGDWYGKADILRKVEGKSNLGNYSYEIMDTKLSRETKAGAILQLCLYSEMLEAVIEAKPEFMYVVTPGDPFTELEYRVNDYQSYYRLIKDYFLKAMDVDQATYPEPTAHCDICKWFEHCDKRRRADDHLTYVAGLTSSQRKELEKIGIKTLESFAKAKKDFHKGLDTNPESILRAKEQARLQLDARKSGKPKFEILPIEEERGLNRLPEPCDGDIFFDLEGDQFYKDAGIEYLWGFTTLERGKLTYKYKWAFNYKEEKQCFEWFIDYVVEQKKKYPHLKVYHYASYEPGALKRLMGRYASKETEIDNLLRTGTFVDLYSIARQSIRAGIEKYSIKDLEQFYGYVRKANLRDMAPHKRSVEHLIELDRAKDISDESREIVRKYNQDDTDSTFYLRQWLEELRAAEIKNGETLTRPPELDGETSEELDEHLQRLNDIRDALQKGISQIPEERTEKEQAQWLLGDLVAFYRREDKVNFWEKFRLKELDAMELLEDKSGISGLTYLEDVGGTAKCPIQRYKFIDQVIDIKSGAGVFKEGFLSEEKVESFGTIEEINHEEGYVDIKKKTGKSDFHPNALWAWGHIDKKNKTERMLELAEFVTKKKIDSKDLKYKAARDILLRRDPDLKKKVDLDSKDSLKLATEMALALNHSYLAIQGPPGTGKSYTASKVVLELAKKGYRIGVTGLSHKVICNLMNKISEANVKEKVKVKLYQKTNEDDQTNPKINYINKADEINELLSSEGPFIMGGTDFMWSSASYADKLDYLVIDEAGQFSLVGIMSIAHTTKNIIMLGDGAQLKQPIQGAHPDGCEVSALDYIVGNHQTLPKEKGVFLPITYRLHPKICRFNSELFYENRLEAIPQNVCQVIKGKTSFAGKHLEYVEVEHWGNSNHSMEEVQRIKEIVEDLVKGKNTYTVYKDGKEHTERITLDSIKIISPYNAQVNRIRQAIPGVSVGTVDKFQGQEAPIVIYSVATSTPEDAPRGMDFLYSGNRLNVAVSRAECLFIMVASKKIFEPNCKSPAQMKLANSYCRYLEMVNK